MTHIVCISDTHNKHDSLSPPEGDILIHAGDTTLGGSLPDLESAVVWLGRQPFKHKVLIAGNHDWCFQDRGHPRREPEVAKDLCAMAGVTYLQDSGVELCGLKLWGSPWTPEFSDWAFNLPRNSGALLAARRQIPDDTDVLITHGPPGGIRDVTQEGASVGCRFLRSRVDNMPGLKLHVFGHIHEAYGKSIMGRGTLGRGVECYTTFVNACSLNREYRPVNPPIMVDL